MSDIVSVGKTLFDVVTKLVSSHKEKTEEERMRAFVEEMRLRVYTGGGNCFRPTVASEEDRFCSKMVAKNLLVKLPMGGYMLPETFRQWSGLYS